MIQIPATIRNSSLICFLVMISLSLPWTGCKLQEDIKEGKVHIRVNQVGYLIHESKSAIVFSRMPVKGKIALFDASTEQEIIRIRPNRNKSDGWGAFSYYYHLDITSVTREGSYYFLYEKTGDRSQKFAISTGAYDAIHESLLVFMRQQRCGYNPYLDMVCHQQDGMSFYGSVPDSTFIDVSGGWHDAGDQLKYLITGSYATAHMLKAFELYPAGFEDRVDEMGRRGANGIPDVLDEARWGLDWILKLHPWPGELVHQVADDRDHVGWKMPDQDPSDYGWGKNSYRAAYFATGEPQGLGGYLSQATGVSNLAGRSAAALALASRIWGEEAESVETAPMDKEFAQKCREAAESLYALGKTREGFQQGNSFGAPYRYGELTWADDMEWAAAELYSLTGMSSYLEDAKNYSRMAGTNTWMPFDTAEHYQYYPFVNMGHYALHQVADDGWKDTLAAYYLNGIESCMERADTNPYGIGIPFIWCSNNLLTGLVTQMILYGEMTGDRSYEAEMLKQRDWLFGRNPWGTSMFTGIPEGGEYPLDVHTSVWALTGEVVPGGLVDGPVYGTIYRSLKGLHLTNPDEFEALQNPFVVYHDDIGDYSTNEPTMDGTAGAILMMAHFSEAGSRQAP